MPGPWKGLNERITSAIFHIPLMSCCFPCFRAAEGDEERSQFIVSAQTGDLDAVRSFVDHSEVTIDVGHSDHSGLNALHAAVIGQQHQVVAFLLAHGADVHSMTPTGVALFGVCTL
jgi:ankyrin repeat protein